MHLARAFGSHITLAHVLCDGEPDTKDSATRLLERLSRGARHRPKFLLESPSHDIARRIVEAAQREGSDMILIGTHAHAPAERIRLGSVAHGVAVLAEIPVMMIPVRIKKTDLEGRWLQATQPSTLPDLTDERPSLASETRNPKRSARESERR